MPTERFYRLPAGKRDVISRALRKEFARVPFEKASINQIIRNAEISRGSFYTYFYDKDDAANFILEESYMQIRWICETTLEGNGGDYLGMLKELFEHLVTKLESAREMMAIARNVLFIHEENGMLPGYGYGLEDAKQIQPCKRKKGERLGEWLLRKVDKSKLKIQTEEEFDSLVILGINALVYSIRQYYEYPDQIGRIRMLFEAKLNMLRNGAYQLQNR